MAKKLCGHAVSEFGLGTWGIGGSSSPDLREDRASVEAIRYAIDRGINVIDTAEMYAAGHTEELVGEAIEPYDRKSLFIITKVWNTNLTHNRVLNSARQSLKRLRTQYVDLYLIHWPNPSVPIGETIAAMEELVSTGLARNIGVSNFSVAEMQGAIGAARYAKICANQIKYNYGTRQPETDIIPFCEKNSIEVIAYTPIMKGRAGGYRALKSMAEKYGVNPVQMSLRYVMERSLPIPKSTNATHIDELLEAAKIPLTREDYELLRNSR